MGTNWALDFEFTYQNTELVYVKPAATTPIEDSIDVVRNLQVVHVPPFSGIGADEPRLDKPYQDVLIGQGRPGEILRNLLYELHTNAAGEWGKICADVEEIFGYVLLPPIYEGRPYILCQYQEKDTHTGTHRNTPKFDISSAGSGFLQVLFMLCFFYARPASILLLDEPDAHLHVVLQKQVYDRLRRIARERRCQLLIATHSEVLVDGTSPELILSFYNNPHKLISDVDRDQIREALKRLDSLDILMAEQSLSILYLEDETDFNLLREWGRVLKHPICDFFDHHPFFHFMKGRNPSEAHDHFFAIQAVQSKIQGIIILDGDNRKLPDHELRAENLLIMRWTRYEAESYLLNPAALSRFIAGTQPDLWTNDKAKKGIEYLKKQLPPTVFENPVAEHEYLNVTAASKTLIPGFFKAAELPLTKNEYYQIASQMKPDEIPLEVKQKLDEICAIFTKKQID